nr:cellulose binding domain-containing protein [Pleurocapsa sp. MO_192.B19]
MQLLTNNNLLQTDFSIKTQWDQGFTGRLDIFNPGETIQDWTLEFESPFEIEPSMIWGAEIVSHEGDRYVLEPLDDNETINSQQEISVFFNANKVNGQIIKPKNISFGDDSSSVIEAPVEDTPEPAADVPTTDNSSVIDASVEDTPEPAADVPTTDNSSVIDASVEDTPE